MAFDKKMYRPLYFSKFFGMCGIFFFEEYLLSMAMFCLVKPY